MSSPTAMSSAGLSIEDLRQLVKKDLAASNELQDRIDQIRASGVPPNSKELSLMGVEHKQIGRDLVFRIDEIEQQKNLTAADRTMLQALTARLGVHDLQSARIAELGDLRTPKEWLEAEEVPKSVRPSFKARSASSPSQIQAGAKTQPLLEPVLAPDEEFKSEEEVSALMPVRPRDESDVEDEDEDDGSVEYDLSDDEAESEVDKSSWPLLYRILDIDPKTPDYLFHEKLDNCYKALELKHDPDRHPNDQSAAERWTACNKAYSILVDPERKKFYDLHGKIPKDLQDFDISKLNINDAF